MGVHFLSNHRIHTPSNGIGCAGLSRLYYVWNYIMGSGVGPPWRQVPARWDTKWSCEASRYKEIQNRLGRLSGPERVKTRYFQRAAGTPSTFSQRQNCSLLYLGKWVVLEQLEGQGQSLFVQRGTRVEIMEIQMVKSKGETAGRKQGDFYKICFSLCLSWKVFEGCVTFFLFQAQTG